MSRRIIFLILKLEVTVPSPHGMACRAGTSDINVYICGDNGAYMRIAEL